MKKLQINKNLLAIKGYYLLWNGGAFTMMSFTPVFAKQLGYSSFILGIVCAVLPLSGMIAKPLMGMVADKFSCQKLLFLIFQLGTVISFLTMIFLPELPTTTEIRLTCDSSNAVLEKFNGEACEGTLDSEFMCNLECPFEPNHREIICNNWKTEQYCINHPDSLSFAATITENFTNQTNICTYIVKTVKFEDGETLSHPNCPSHPYTVSSNCSIWCGEPHDFLLKSNDAHIARQYEFWLLLLLFIVAWICQAVTGSIGDAICYQILDNKPYNYGYQRMWGALGCGILSISCGVLVDTFSDSETKKNYTPVFLTGSIAVAASIIVCAKIKYTQQKMSAHIVKDVGRLLSNFRIWIFMLFCMCVGMCTALTWYFLFWHLEDLAAIYGHNMQSNMKTIEGLILGIQSIGGDLPFLFLSGWIFRKIGHVNTMSFILMVIAVKFLLYSFLTNPWWCLPIEFLNGPTYGLFYATMTSYASLIAPPGTEATTQGLVGAIFEGVGLALGSIIGGLFFNEYGGSITFRIFSISTFIAFLLHVGVQYIIRSVEAREKGTVISS